MANVKTPLVKYSICKNRFIRTVSAGYTAVLSWCYRAIFLSKPRSPGVEYKYTCKIKWVSKLSNVKFSKGFFKEFFVNCSSKKRKKRWNTNNSLYIF